MSIWRDPLPLVLASGSETRRKLLAATQIPFDVCPADIDERALEASLLASEAGPAAVAPALARAKAVAVGVAHPAHLVLGADQTLVLDGRLFAKPRTRTEAAAHLAAFSGRTHELHAAVCLVRSGEVLFEATPVARLTCRILSPDFIDAYLDAAGDAVLTSVGAYQLEALGVHLFSHIEGDHSTILGLPLFPVLDVLRRHGSLWT